MKSTFTLLIIFSFFSSQSILGQINHEWSFSIGSKESEGVGGNVVDHEGNVYIVMQMKDTVDIDPGPAVVEIVPETAEAWILTKYDANGNLVFGYPFYADDNSAAVVLEAKYNQVRMYVNFRDSLIYVQNGDREKLHEHPGANSALITLDLEGNIIDSYYYAVPEAYYVTSLYTFADGRILIAGSLSDTLIFNPLSPITLVSAGDEDGFFMMLDADYLPLWYQHFKGTGYDYIETMTIINDREIYFAAGWEDTMRINTTSGEQELVSAGEQDGLYGHMSITGELDNLFSLQGTGYEEVRDITADKDGNMYICGDFEQTLNFAHPTQAPKIRTATNEGDGYIAKYDENGLLQWLGIYTTTGYGGVYTVDLKRNDELYFTGTFSEKGDLNPGSDSMIVNTYYHSSPFISKLKTNGDFLWSVPFVTNEVAGIREISILTEDSRIVVNGFFYDSLHMGTVPGENWLNTDYGADCFVASYSEENVMTASHDLDNFSTETFSIYPNPALENINIRCKDELNSISLFNAAGELIRRMDNVRSNEVNMNLAELPAGIYYLQGNSKENIITGKVTKQ